MLDRSIAPGKVRCGIVLMSSVDRCLSTKAVFVDTDAVPGLEGRAGNLIQNEVEATLVCQVSVACSCSSPSHRIGQFIDALTRCDVKEDDIGVVSLYRQQLKLITSMLNGRKDIELLTADKSQGRDKECIVISMVRSNDTQHVSHIRYLPSAKLMQIRPVIFSKTGVE